MFWRNNLHKGNVNSEWEYFALHQHLQLKMAAADSGVKLNYNPGANKAKNSLQHVQDNCCSLDNRHDQHIL